MGPLYEQWLGGLGMEDIGYLEVGLVTEFLEFVAGLLLR